MSNDATSLSQTLYNPEYRIKIKLLIKIVSKLKKNKQNTLLQGNIIKNTFYKKKNAIFK